MTQEEKAKAYDEALERAKKAIKYPDKPCFARVDEIFPELKESEDEKWIPKEIAKYLKEKGGFRSCWLAWLEKQGEQKPADKVEPKFKDGDLIYVSTEEKGVQAIFHEYKNKTIFFHCYLCSDFVQGGYMPIGSVELIYPLQKVHYKKFFEKMHEAGYEWNAEKKELTKIEQKPVVDSIRRIEIEKAAFSTSGIIEQEEWFIKGAEWADEHPYCQ